MLGDAAGIVVVVVWVTCPVTVMVGVVVWVMCWWVMCWVVVGDISHQ